MFQTIFSSSEASKRYGSDVSLTWGPNHTWMFYSKRRDKTSVNINKYEAAAIQLSAWKQKQRTDMCDKNHWYVKLLPAKKNLLEDTVPDG